MKKLTVLKNKVLIEQISKKPEKTSSLFVEAEVSDSLGVVIAIGEEYQGILKIGDKVYYGRDSQQIRMTGKDILVMDPENVVAIVGDKDEKTN